MNEKRLTMLQDLFAQSTAPFREVFVERFVDRILTAARVPFFRDPIGNFVVGASSKAAALKLINARTPEPLRVYMAHMDHPGFHGVQWRNDHQLEIKWYGGFPKIFLEGCPVWVADQDGLYIEGTLNDMTVVDLPPQPALAQKASTLFGAFRFRAPSWEENGNIYTRAADDLAGVFTILSLALDLATKIRRGNSPFLGLITRAEEVGFIGAIAHFELGWFTSKRARPIVCVSLECSRALPGAEIGKGPVVRLGDRFTVFDPGALRVLTDVAARALPERHQRKLMDGGTCEASAATVFGIPAVGISLPLGNYHNENPEGGPSPEFISLSDLEGMVTLCHALLKPKLPWQSPWKEKKTAFQKSLKGYKSLLRS